MNDDTTPTVAIGLIIIVAAVIAATALLLPMDEDREQIQPADTPTPTPPSTVWSGSMNLPPPLTPATVATHAARGPAIQVSEPPPAPTTTALTFTDNCDEMSYYRQQAGLPARFDSIGWRESRCTNTPISRTGCCVGFWQLHWINWNDHRTGPGLQACDATWDNVRGDTPDAKQRQACAAKVLYDVVQYQPWAATT